MAADLSFAVRESLGAIDTETLLENKFNILKRRKNTEDYLQSLSDGSLAMAVKEHAPGDCQICIRGESVDLGEVVPRRFPALVEFESPAIDPAHDGRRELAEWLTRRNNPLTARVAVNRVWQKLFGQALVATPDDFGALRARPTHPDLLDYLAVRFMDEGWSLKRLIRLIVHSRCAV